MANRRIATAIGLALGFLAAGWWYFERTFLAARTAAVDFTNYDLYVYAYPMLQAWFATVRAGDVALWNPYQACGAPLAATENGFFYPFNAAHLLFPTGQAIGYTAVLHFALAGLFQFGFLRALGAGVPAALLGATLFTWTPLFAGYAWYPGLQNATVWIAAMLWACERLVRRQSRGALVALAAAIALQLLAGRTQTVVYTWYLFAPYALARLYTVWRGDPSAGRRLALSLLAALALGAALSAVQILPQLELVGRSMRSTAGISRVAAEAFPPPPSMAQLWDSVVTLGAERWDPNAPVTPFGWLVLACAAFAFGHERGRTAWGLAAAAIVFLVWSAGSRTPLYELYRWLPGGAWFRAPQRMMFLTLYVLGALAALGVDVAARRGARVWWLAVPALAGALVWWQTPAPASFVGVVVVAFLGGWVLLAVPVPLARAGGAGVIACTLAGALFTLRSAPHAHPATRDLGYERADRGARRAIARRLRDGRRVVFPYQPFQGVPLAKVGVLDRYPTVTDYEPLTLRRFADLVTRFSEVSTADPFGAVVFYGDVRVAPSAGGRRLLDLTSAQLLLQRGESPQADPFVAAGLSRVLDDGMVRLYENPTALPRAYVVPHAIVEPDGVRTLARLAAPAFDARTHAIVDESPAIVPQPGATGTATLIRDDADVVVIAVETSGNALLVLTDTHYPGWSVTVDGRATPLLRANYLFRAVALPGGAHEVRFAFRPRSFLLGVLLTLSAGLCAVGLLVWRRRPLTVPD
jgi:hypothetical protein